MVVQLAGMEMSELLLYSIARQGKDGGGDCNVSPLLLAQPPWAVSTVLTLVNGAVTGLEAPFDEAWRILLPDHLKRLQYRASLLPEGMFLSEGG